MAHGDITHVELPVTDFAAATAFFGGVFGWNIAEQAGFEGYPMWSAPNGISGGGLVERTNDVTQPRIIVEVDSIEAALASAKDMGGTVLLERSPITETSAWAAFTDPDDNVIGIYEETAKPDES